MTTGSATFVTVADARYYPGLVGLVNSLRLTGNQGEIVVLDVGLTDAQRTAAGAHCRLVRPDEHAAIPDHPMLAKCAAPKALGIEGVVVFVDSDVIVTDDLGDVVARAAAGGVVAVPDLDDRWFAEWESLLGLPCPPRRQRYVNSGVVAFSTEHWPELAGWWADAGSRIPPERTRSGGADLSDPLWDSDQDALNAVLMTRLPADALDLLANEQLPTTQIERSSARVIDAPSLRCESGGVPTLAVHYAGMHAKPWLPSSRWRVERDVYTTLLTRLLFDDALALQVPRDAVTPWVAAPARLVPRHLRNRSLRAVAWAWDQFAGRVRARFRRHVLRKGG